MDNFLMVAGVFHLISLSMVMLHLLFCSIRDEFHECGLRCKVVVEIHDIFLHASIMLVTLKVIMWMMGIKNI